MKKFLTVLIISGLAFISCSDDKKEDTTSPTVSIVSPLDGELISENLIVAVEANDNEEIDYVELHLNSGLNSTQTPSSSELQMQFTLDLSGLEGAQTLKAIAFDKAGNSAESAEITITIDPYAESFAMEVVEINAQGVEVGWTKYNGPFGIYILRKSETSGVSLSSDVVDTIFAAADTTLSIAGLAPDSDYYFKVWAVRIDELMISTNEIHVHTDTSNIETTDTTMILIASTTFSRGNVWSSLGGNDDTPSARIYIDAFYIDKFEVTYRQYQEFVDAGGYTTEEYWSEDGWGYIHDLLDMQPGFWGNPAYHSGDDYPVVGVSFYEAEAFAKWAGKRLPTEAEWELAARGTEGEDIDFDTFADGLIYPWGEDFFADEQVHCNFNDSESSYNDGFTNNAPIGSFTSGDSPYGVSDMSGNVAEWCSDWWDHEYYETASTDNPTGPLTGERKIIRGGSYINLCGINTDEGFDFRTFIREYREPDDQKKQIGFRCVRDID